MGVWRKWIFPSLRIVIFAVIAVALVKLAFFADPGEAPEPDAAFASMISPEIPVTVGTIANDVVLKGTVAADEAVEVRSTAPGTVRTVHAGPGAWVDAGQDLLVVREEVFRDDGTSWLRDIKVTAPASGTVSSLAIIAGQTVTIGEVIAKIAPPSFHVTAELQPEQQYRLLDRPSEAVVTVTGGPAGFTCTGLTITAALAGAEDAATSTSIRCAVPAEVTVFAGLAAEVTISGGASTDVLTVPITAVEGTSGTGLVHLVLDDGSTEPREVELGLTDGKVVEIRAGVTEGDLVLEFVPGAAADLECGPGTEMMC